MHNILMRIFLEDKTIRLLILSFIMMSSTCGPLHLNYNIFDKDGQLVKPPIFFNEYIKIDIKKVTHNHHNENSSDISFDILIANTSLDTIEFYEDTLLKIISSPISFRYIGLTQLNEQGIVVRNYHRGGIDFIAPMDSVLLKCLYISEQDIDYEKLLYIMKKEKLKFRLQNLYFKKNELFSPIYESGL